MSRVLSHFEHMASQAPEDDLEKSNKVIFRDSIEIAYRKKINK